MLLLTRRQFYGNRVAALRWIGKGDTLVNRRDRHPRALTYCQGLVRQPHDTILVLISDLYGGGNREEMLKRAAALVSAGVQVIALLALNDDGAPSFECRNAAALGAMDIPAFACTPDLFPDLMATAIGRRDIGQWAALHGIVTASRSVAQ